MTLSFPKIFNTPDVAACLFLCVTCENLKNHLRNCLFVVAGGIRKLPGFHFLFDMFLTY